MRRVAAWLALLLLATAPAPRAQDAVPAHVAEAIAAHGRCAESGASSATCAAYVTGPCLDRARDAAELAACRIAMTRALEREEERLTGLLAAARERSRAMEIAAGARRQVDAFCDGIAAAGTADPEGHAARCALLAAHVTVYHLHRQLAALERDT